MNKLVQLGSVTMTTKGPTVGRIKDANGVQIGFCLLNGQPVPVYNSSLVSDPFYTPGQPPVNCTN